MGPDLEKAIYEISLRMCQLKTMQENKPYSEGLTERDVMILEALHQRGVLTIS